MSYSRQINEANEPLFGNFTNDRLFSDIKDGITIIHGHTLTIRQLALSDPELENSSAKVQDVVRDGKQKIQEVSKKLNIYSKRNNFTSVEETQKKIALQQLSKRYLEVVKNFENESKNYMNNLFMKNNAMVEFDSSDMAMHDEDETNVFTRKSSSAFDSNKEGISINIYDYNFGLSKYEQFNNENGNKCNNNDASIDKYNYNQNYKRAQSGRSSEFQSVNSALAEKEGKKFKKNSYVKGNKYKDINEFLLQDKTNDDKITKDGIYDDDDLNYNERKFVSVSTMDIDNEILKQKNKEIKKLHKDIINIHELYKELSEQINVQGENLDNIDSHIINTHQNIVMSGREIQITRYRYARNSRYLFFFLFFIILLVIIIMVVLKVI